MPKKKARRPPDPRFTEESFFQELIDSDGASSIVEVKYKDAFGEYSDLGRLALIAWDVLTDLRTADDRSLVVVGMAFLDDLLARLLRKSMIPTRATDRILDVNGVLGTFKGRVDTCEALGLVKSETAIDLAAMGSIRNDFAHRFDVHGLETYLAGCRKLRPYKPLLEGDSDTPEARRLFMNACRGVALELIRAMHFTTSRTPPSDEPIPIPVYSIEDLLRPPR